MVNSYESIMFELKEMVAMPLSPSMQKRVGEIYWQVFGKQIQLPSCKCQLADKYEQVIAELYRFLQKNPNHEIMEKPNYMVKRGQLVQPTFGGKMYTYGIAMPNDVAESFLAKDKENIKFFEIYPEDWEERIKGFGKNEKPKKTRKKSK